MEDYHTTNSHYITYTFLLKRLGECTFLNLGVKGLKPSPVVRQEEGTLDIKKRRELRQTERQQPAQAVQAD